MPLFCCPDAFQSQHGASPEWVCWALSLHSDAFSHLSDHFFLRQVLWSCMHPLVKLASLSFCCTCAFNSLHTSLVVRLKLLVSFMLSHLVNHHEFHSHKCPSLCTKHFLCLFLSRALACAHMWLFRHPLFSFIFMHSWTCQMFSIDVCTSALRCCTSQHSRPPIVMSWNMVLDSNTKVSVLCHDAQHSRMGACPDYLKKWCSFELVIMNKAHRICIAASAEHGSRCWRKFVG